MRDNFGMWIPPEAAKKNGPSYAGGYGGQGPELILSRSEGNLVLSFECLVLSYEGREKRYLNSKSTSYGG